MEPLAHRILSLLRSTGRPLPHESVRFLLKEPPDEVSATLAELCASGPVVAIEYGGDEDHDGDCWYALEWGVRAPWETEQP